MLGTIYGLLTRLVCSSTGPYLLEANMFFQEALGISKDIFFSISRGIITKKPEKYWESINAINFIKREKYLIPFTFKAILIV